MDKDKKIERRVFEKMELRVSDETEDEPKLMGYAALFDELSDDLGGFREKIHQGAFDRSLEEGHDVRGLWNHEPKYVLGRTTAGTLRLMKDEKGLFFELDPPEAQWAKDLMVSIQRGDVNQMSFGFRTINDEWTQEADEQAIRTLIDVDLIDISPVTFPAYPQTTAEVREKAQELMNSRQEPIEDGEDEPNAQERLDMIRRKLKIIERE